jgi:Flp pilus assembly protein TadG
MPTATEPAAPIAFSQPPRRRRRRHLSLFRREEGQALAEFALVAPVLCLLVLAMAYCGIALVDWVDETQLVSQGARYAAVNQNPGAAEKKTLLQWLQAQGVDKHITTEAKATICSPTSKVKDWVEVKLEYKYKWIPILQFKAAETPVVVTAQNRIEREPSSPYPTSC